MRSCSIGPKSVDDAKDGEAQRIMEEEEERQEDLQEVRASLRELLLVLLASPKHGVLFSDPEYGCDKSSNPLVTEVGP